MLEEQTQSITDLSADQLEAQINDTPTAAVAEAPIMSQDVSVDAYQDQPLTIPEKFRGKGVEDILKSYTNLESMTSRIKQENESLKAKANKADQLEAMLAQQQVQQQYQAQQPVQSTTTAPQDNFMEVWERDPAAAVLMRTELAERKMEQYMKSVATQNHYAQVKTQYPDFAELEPTMVQLAQRWVNVVGSDKMNSPEVVDALYYMAKGASVDQRMQSAKQQGIKEAQQLQREKQSAFSEGSTPPRGTVAPENLSLEELEKMLGVVTR